MNLMLPSLYLFLAMMMMAVQPAPVEERGLKGTLLKLAGRFIGKATFFNPKEEGGDTGACGPHEDVHSQIVALNLHQYGSANAVSYWCFKKVLIRSGGKTTTATITDACPGCQEKSLDLTPSVFEKLASFSKGIVDIEWCVIGTEDCDDDGSEGGKSKDKGSKKKDN